MGLTFAEKFLGLLIVVIGVLTVYVSHTNPPSQPVMSYSVIFMAMGFLLIALGAFLVLVKAE